MEVADFRLESPPGTLSLRLLDGNRRDDQKSFLHVAKKALWQRNPIAGWSTKT
jgi:hypothetical protein